MYKLKRNYSFYKVFLFSFVKKIWTKKVCSSVGNTSKLEFDGFEVPREQKVT
jgi:hypothetical protein